MTKLELTKEEAAILIDKLWEAVNEGAGQLIEIGNNTIEIVCSFCGGEGSYPVDETDSDGNTMRGVGTQKCECKTN